MKKSTDVPPKKDVDASPQHHLTPEQIEQVDNLLTNGGGVTYEEIATAIEFAEVFSSGPNALETYLLKRIAADGVRRLWNNDLHAHFYVVAR